MLQNVGLSLGLITILIPLAAFGVLGLAAVVLVHEAAEIFVIGTAIALVKVGGLATISFGPAFWAFCGLILVNAASNAFTSATTIWDAIEDAGLATDGREMVDPAG